MTQERNTQRNPPSKVLPKAKPPLKLPTKANEVAALDLRFIPPLWIYKCNIESLQNGDWKVFFEREREGDGEWGGTWCIESKTSLKFLREEIQVRDLMLAWQSDRREAVGLCRVADLPDDGGEISIVLKTVMQFANPVKLLPYKKIHDAIKHGKGFQPGGGTLFATTSPEAKVILRLCGVPASLLWGR